MGAADEFGLQHQILGRIAGDLKLGAQQQVCAFGPPPHLQHRPGIAFEIADALVHLRERNAKAVSPFGGHAGDLASAPGSTTFAESACAAKARSTDGDKAT